MSAVADGCIQFGVLGTLQMTVGGTLLRLGTPKQRAVLAMLVINRNRAVGNDTQSWTRVLGQ
jgi:DNA-binding SARP family transcriptional activator